MLFHLAGQWEGFDCPAACPAGFEPDFGPGRINPHTGVVAVGATPWVVNYNVLLTTFDLAVARKIARAISARGGGLPKVQSMALIHSNGMAHTPRKLRSTGCFTV